MAEKRKGPTKGSIDDRRSKRHDMGDQRLNATLAIIQEDKTTGCLVPIKDFSETGAGVYIKFEVPPQTIVFLSLEGLDFSPIEGRVIWCAASDPQDPQTPATHPFRLGIDFSARNAEMKKLQAEVYKYVSGLLDE